MMISDKEMTDMIADARTRREGFEALVRQYSEPLYWKIRHIVITHEDADDVLQNTFLKAWKNIDDFHNKSKLSTWLFSIAIHEALNYMRKKKRESGVMGDVSLADSLVADGNFDGDKAQALLYEAMATLPDVQRTVFNLRYFDDMKYSEISGILGTSEGALKASYHIAVKKIYDYFEKKGDFAD